MTFCKFKMVTKESKAIRLLTALGAVIALQACSVEPLRSHEPRDDDAKILFKTSGSNYNVQFAISTNPGACAEFESVGTVTNPDERSEWAKRLALYPKLRIDFVESGKPVQIKAYSKQIEDNTIYTCRPFVVRFKPMADHIYETEFEYLERKCQLLVKDVTDPEKKVDVDTQTKLCRKPIFGALDFSRPFQGP